METNQPQVLFIGGHPILNVKNVAASLDYYCARLGFQQDFCWPRRSESPADPAPTFAQVSRGRFSLMLAQQTQGGPAMWLYLDLASLADLAALYQEYQASAAKILQPPTNHPWYMREMLVEDVDGHTLRIGAPHHHH